MKKDYSQKHKKNFLNIKDLPNHEKPREKLYLYGPKKLSLADLIAIVLQTGTKKENIIKMSSRLLKEYGNQAISDQKNPQTLSQKFNIPTGKAYQLIACFEIGKRLFKENQGLNKIIKCARDAYYHLYDMKNKNKEQFRGLYLDSRAKLIHDEIISIGTLNCSLVHPREVFRPAIEYNCASLIIAHNHPSGSLKPSLEDIEVSNNLIKAGKILGIELLDHIIISKNGYSKIPLNKH